MLGPAAVRAAAAAVWLLAVLGLGLSQPDEHSSDPGFSLCSDCFYRQTPPQGASAGLQLRPRCHRLPGGQAYATLSTPTCDTAVYTAFHLSHGWIEKGGEIVAEDKVDGVRVPGLLRGGGGPSQPVPPTDSPLQHWDSTVTALVQSSIVPQCSAAGGDVYVLTGAGRLGADEDGDEECQMKLLWSAACCAPPEGKAGFSVGFVKETGGGERQVSMKELEEVLGVAELFSEGCGGEEKETAAISERLHSDDLPVSVGNTEADTNSENADPDVDQDSKRSREASRTSEQVADVDAHSETKDVSDVTEETAAETETSVSCSDQQHDVHETVSEEDSDSNSTNTLVFILSTTLYIITAPLHPVFSTITELPAQVTYVLQEDLGVLTALPGDTYAVFHLLTSDLLSWMGSATEMLLGIGETCFSSAYYCSSSMLEVLLSSCHTGVTGVGTLAEDTVGICGDVLDNAWSVTRYFGGQLWEQTEGYVGTVMSEMGGQAQTVGGGLGKLVWRSSNGVGNVFRLGGWLIMEMVDVVIGGVKEAFGQESE